MDYQHDGIPPETGMNPMTRLGRVAGSFEAGSFVFRTETVAQRPSGEAVVDLAEDWLLGAIA